MTRDLQPSGLSRKCVGGCAEAMTLFAFLRAPKNGDPHLEAEQQATDISHPLAVPEI